MNTIIGFLIGFIYIYALLLIPIGAIQVIVSLFKSLQKGKQPQYYKDLATYWKLVAIYFGAGLIGYKTEYMWANPNEGIIVGAFIIIVPTIIAIYNFKILRRKYHQQGIEQHLII